MAYRDVWTFDDFSKFTDIRIQFREARPLETKLIGLSGNFRDPKLFWRKLELLSGRTQLQDTYLITDNRQRVFSDFDEN